MSLFTQEELSLSKNVIFKKNSKYCNNDELIKYHLELNNLLTYKCYSQKCPTKNGNWKRKKMYLFLERKNSQIDDLRVKNLSLICANCFFLDKAPNIIEKIKKNKVKQCKFCSYQLNNTWKGTTCFICIQKMRQTDVSFSNDETAIAAGKTFRKDAKSIEDMKTILAEEDKNSYSPELVTSSSKNTRINGIIKINKASNSNVKNTTANINIKINTQLEKSVLDEINDIF